MTTDYRSHADTDNDHARKMARAEEMLAQWAREDEQTDTHNEESAA